MTSSGNSPSEVGRSRRRVLFCDNPPFEAPSSDSNRDSMNNFGAAVIAESPANPPSPPAAGALEDSEDEDWQDVLAPRRRPMRCALVQADVEQMGSTASTPGSSSATSPASSPHPPFSPHTPFVSPRRTLDTPCAGTSRDSPFPSTSQDSPLAFTSRASPLLSTSRDSPLPSTSRDSPLPSTSQDSPVVGEDRAIEEVFVARNVAAEPFNWNSDFSKFHSQKEVFRGNAGPIYPNRHQDAFKCFHDMWDEVIMAKIVRQTNKYGMKLQAASEQAVSRSIEEAANTDKIRPPIPNRPFRWEPTNLEEMYRLFKIFILQSLVSLAYERDYFHNEVPEIQFNFGKIIPMNRFKCLKRCLHFADDDELADIGNLHDRRLFKVQPIIDHCNKTFKEFYNLGQNIAIDESLTLWKGKLSFVQYIKTKVAKFGVKSYELCESETGYLYSTMYYAGKDANLEIRDGHAGEETLNSGVEVVKLLESMYDKGHVVHMDNYYSCPLLARYLKSRRTDFVGTLQCKRKNVPQILKITKAQYMEKNDIIALHSGDVMVVSWKDKRKVTMISTYHQNEVALTKYCGRDVLKPVAVLDYNANMGGIDFKDQRLSTFAMERKRNQKWSMKVFKRLLNTSILNAFIIHSKSTGTPNQGHRNYRYKVVHGLSAYLATLRGDAGLRDPLAVREPVPILRNLPRVNVARDVANHPVIRDIHCPVHCMDERGMIIHSIRCVLCRWRGEARVGRTKYACSVCLKPLCVPNCFYEFHTAV